MEALSAFVHCAEELLFTAQLLEKKGQGHCVDEQCSTDKGCSMILRSPESTVCSGVLCKRNRLKRFMTNVAINTHIEHIYLER